MRVGSLFAGYGGLDLGLEQALGTAEPAWFSEIDAAPSRILAHHWPDVPNLGDITAIDWAAVEPVDVLTGGFPCQDVSLAGLRRGLRPDTRSGLWAHFAAAIDALRPPLVIIENVRGLLSAEAHSDLEPDPWALGDGNVRPPLRALGAVLGDLADLGYDAEWQGVRAADVGAPHGRFRVFLLATPQDADVAARGQRRVAASRQTPGGWAWADARRRDRTHAANSDRAVGCGPGSIPSGAPKGTQYETGRGAGRGSSSPAWGAYGPAIHRWEHIIGRLAPAPTEPGMTGGQRLAPRFVEWMMGLPAGHVTDVGLTRNEQLKALGNGVVPQQAALAFTRLLRQQASAA